MNGQRITTGEFRARLPGLHDWVIGAPNMQEELSREMNRASRAIFYPHRWSRDIPESLARHLVDCMDVARSDIRRYRYLAHKDATVVQLHNWRKFEVWGIHLFEHDIHLQRSKTATNTHRKAS